MQRTNETEVAKRFKVTMNGKELVTGTVCDPEAPSSRGQASQLGLESTDENIHTSSEKEDILIDTR